MKLTHSLCQINSKPVILIFCENLRDSFQKLQIPHLSIKPILHPWTVKLYFVSTILLYFSKYFTNILRMNNVMNKCYYLSITLCQNKLIVIPIL